MPKIFLPLDKVDKCDTCGNIGNLKLCSQCAERAYCSVTCQKQNWRTGHKATCRTDRIDLTSFHPILACIAESARLHAPDIHPAFDHRVVNSPEIPVETLPDGSSARIIKLGPPLRANEWTDDLRYWWPNEPSPAVRNKLSRRIGRGGKVLPIVMSTCLSIMLAIYSTTTARGVEGHRVRLRYRSSPISDFGIVAGSARVAPEDQLAYMMPDQSIIKGQDPNDHYWIYFQTQKGEEVLLDCNLFTFDICMVVRTQPYLAESPNTKIPLYIPTWFKDRTMARGLAGHPPLLIERRRFSVLRDNSIRMALESVHVRNNGAVGMAEATATVFTTFMSRIAGRPIADSERQFMIRSLVQGVDLIVDPAVRTDKWKRFPIQPVGMETAPGEVTF